LNKNLFCYLTTQAIGLLCSENRQANWLRSYLNSAWRFLSRLYQAGKVL